MASKPLGNLTGLKPSQVTAISRLYNRRFPDQGGFSPDQARELTLLSRGVGRQIGVLINRKGVPVMVIVGEQDGILIPELSRHRQADSRLSGLRLLHTHLDSALLTQEDLMDMVFLRLDAVCVLTVSSEGGPRTCQIAHILPPNADELPYQVHPAMIWDEVDFDFGANAKALEDELARTGQSVATAAREGSAILVSVASESKGVQERSLAELAELAATAGLDVVGQVVQRVTRVNPKLILGRGKLAELEVLALQKNAATLVFDQELTPTQQRNLSQITERKVLDRTQLILDIFAQHAQTREGKLQVEMAQLKYMMPRLVGQNRALSRLTGGIGGRGPGETRLEMDRRKIRERIAQIKTELLSVRKHRKSTRSRRDKAGLPVVSLVGYTNAGKSTLLNTLTKSEVLAENKLFATLDPTSRRLRFPEDREIILTDTVGFIRHLPADLREAFMATLEELEGADVLVHVADASHPEMEAQVDAVESILRDLSIDAIPRILALNKIDRISDETREALAFVHPEAVFISAIERPSLAHLVERIKSLL
ncbi:MAG: GTPase HflX [Desulfomicrobium sp.]|nr:GTPase HflX [Pseudomonadota bacterium]MBV1712757.1 GTPase HflX [Desulfomicrobium sp.]MBU4571727.1 GTPase HflX [Pseudomonadota bacterium]MBU4595876.1 GTPase HflX [Pseudomonadota bacterium]MBV1721180.1 GTPase HflX [Desulfomicrobium sp.]